MTVHTADSRRVRRGVEQRRGIPGGNTRRRFHGTIRECYLGDNSSENALCRLNSCNLCRIIQVPFERTASVFQRSGVVVLQSSFQLAKAGQRTNFGRFGAGIYTSATSSKVCSSSSCTWHLSRSGLVISNTGRLTTTPLGVRLQTRRCSSTML